MEKQKKVFFGNKAIHNAWGIRGMARGMYSGGYTRWIYGVKGIFNIIILECWGDFRDMKID